MNQWAFSVILPKAEYDYNQCKLMYKLYEPQYKPVYEVLVDIAKANNTLLSSQLYNFLVGSRRFVFIDDPKFNTLHRDLNESFYGIKSQLEAIERLAHITKYLYNMFNSLSSWELMRVNMHTNFVQALLDLGVVEPKGKKRNLELDQRMVNNASSYIEEVNYAIAFNDLLR